MLNDLQQQFDSWNDFVIIWSRGFFLQNVRYFTFAGLLFLVLFRWKKKFFHRYRISKKVLNISQIIREVKWSLISAVEIGFFYLIILYATAKGYTKVYFGFNEHTIWYFILSIVGLVIWHDTWFYWIHRFMHWRPIMLISHKIHHRSLRPSPMASFAFHPLETLLESGFIFIAVFLVPLHPITFLCINLFQMTMNVIGHSSHEFFPRWFVRHPIGKWFNTSTHHFMHHRFFNYNYGLYFNFWDRIMKTNHPDYENFFENLPKNDLGST